MCRYVRILEYPQICVASSRRIRSMSEKLCLATIDRGAIIKVARATQFRRNRNGTRKKIVNVVIFTFSSQLENVSRGGGFQDLATKKKDCSFVDRYVVHTVFFTQSWSLCRFRARSLCPQSPSPSKFSRIDAKGFVPSRRIDAESKRVQATHYKGDRRLS